MFFMKRLTLFAVVSLLLSGCMTASEHLNDVRSSDKQNLTVGVVQKEIRKGMSGADVAAALGSPNIVSTDEDSREVWIYDKISTEYVQSSSESGIGVLLIGIFTGGGVGGSASGSQKAGAASSSQRTFTVIIKFDENKKVRDFAYHTSRF